MKKKLLSILLCGAMTISLVACGSTSYGDKKEEATNIENQTKEEVKNEEKDQPPVTIDQLPLDIIVKEPDSIGTVYLNATFTNNSDKNITGYNATILLKDKNEKTYLSAYDTVLPGETSPVFESFGPDTTNKDDIEILKYEINIDNGDGTTTYLQYDAKLDKYQW